jgi:predicted ATPase
MLKDITLRNFKIWKTTDLLPLAPVTLLLGTNSSGKSSIIQSLLLIRQTVRCNDPNLSLYFGEEERQDSVVMGQFSDVLCRHGSDKYIGIEFNWTRHDSGETPFKFSAKYQGTHSNAAEIHTLRIGIDGQGFHVTRQKRGAFKLDIGLKKTAKLPASRDFKPQSSFTLSPATLAKLDPDARLQILQSSSALLDELLNIIYLGPVRQLAQRQYQWGGITPATIGDDGGRAVDALIASGTAAKAGKHGGELFQQTGIWLQKMGLADGLEIRRLGKSPLHEVWVEREGTSSNLKDVGVGVSQILPVIVAALHAQTGHIVMIEEPESHLHPLAQSTLAELLTTISRERGVQFIIETHSEHLFRRMQTLLAKQEIAPEQCNMYFVEKENGESKIRRLQADEMGRISNWPEKFFGDAIGETRQQTQLMFERLKAAKNTPSSESPQ